MTELTQYESTTLSPYLFHNPAVLLDKDRAMANALLDVIEQKQRPDGTNPYKAQIQKKDYLTYEAWQLLATFSNCHTELEGDVQPVYEDGELVAYMATSVVRDNEKGTVMSRAQMECGMNSFPTRGKEGREKHKAAQSAAQTWAASKACRMAFSFISVLSGFEPTTAEEMYGGGDYAKPAPVQATATVVESKPKASDSTEYGICPLHGIDFFKSPKMRGPAHKYEDENGDEKWCNKNASLWKGELMKAAALAEWNAEQVAEYVKEQYSTTWSKLSFEQAEEVVDFLYALAESAEQAEEDEQITFSPEL